jgi:hypothetical protein
MSPDIRILDFSGRFTSEAQDDDCYSSALQQAIKLAISNT